MRGFLLLQLPAALVFAGVIDSELAYVNGPLGFLVAGAIGQIIAVPALVIGIGLTLSLLF
jgi:hypothetical protein